MKRKTVRIPTMSERIIAQLKGKKMSTEELVQSLASPDGDPRLHRQNIVSLLLALTRNGKVVRDTSGQTVLNRLP